MQSPLMVLLLVLLCVSNGACYHVSHLWRAPAPLLSCHAYASVPFAATRCVAATCCSPVPDDLSVDMTREMFADVRAHFRENGQLDDGQVCKNMMATRVKDFLIRLHRCRVSPSEIHGDGLYATRDIAAGELVTFFPADAMMFWEGGDRTGDMMCFFGAHIPQSERDAKHIATERVKDYELYASAQISAVGDPTRRDDPAYMGHFCNDGSTCKTPERVAAYRSESAAAANAEAVLVENCHFALEATKAIREGEEVLRSYGEGYWLARAGFDGVGTDLRRVGTAADSSGKGGANSGSSAGGPNAQLQAALKASRRGKYKKATSKAGNRAKASKAKAVRVKGRKEGNGFGR
jgi:hypothetical protein